MKYLLRLLVRFTTFIVYMVVIVVNIIIYSPVGIRYLITGIGSWPSYQRLLRPVDNISDAVVDFMDNLLYACGAEQ